MQTDQDSLDELELLMGKLEKAERRFARERKARKEAERIAEKGLRDLYLANQDLDQKVMDRTSQLVKEKQKSEIASESRYQFLSALSRQVRTPLNGVSGMLELLEGHVSDEQAKVWVKSAASSSKDLLRLFSRLVIFVELEEVETDNSVIQTNRHSALRNSRGIHKEQYLVSDILGELEKVWAKKAMAKGKLIFVENHLDSAAELVTNKERFFQLLDEVLDNAVNHGGPGAVHVSAKQVDVVSESEICISVRDSGPGIADAELRYGSETSAEFENTLGVGYSLISKLSELLDISASQVSDSGYVEFQLDI